MESEPLGKESMIVKTAFVSVVLKASFQFVRESTESHHEISRSDGYSSIGFLLIIQ